jgi:hypothetical protein
MLTPRSYRRAHLGFCAFVTALVGFVAYENWSDLGWLGLGLVAVAPFGAHVTWSRFERLVRTFDEEPDRGNNSGAA